jgi:SAM-dependent methyltransferase
MGGDYRELSLASWEASAPGWARWSDHLNRMARPVTDWLLARLDPQPGETVLELAAGTGDVGYEAARRLGPEGRLITSDFSAGMLEHARRRAEQLGVDNAEFRVVDAERIDLADGSVDAVLCRYGYMLMGDPVAALRETRRVLRPGGRAVFAVWGAPERNPWGGVLGRILVERGAIPPPEPGQPGIFALGDAERLRALVAGSGFDEVVVEELPIVLDYGEAASHWDFIVTAAGAVAGVLAALPEEERESIRQDLESRLEPLVADLAGYPLPGLSLNVAAS